MLLQGEDNISREIFIGSKLSEWAAFSYLLQYNCVGHNCSRGAVSVQFLKDVLENCEVSLVLYILIKHHKCRNK